MDKLTDRVFWGNYWNSKTNLIQEVPSKNLFTPIFKKTISSNQKIQTVIELGGFPAQFTIFLKKLYPHLSLTLLDYYIDLDIIEKLLKKNNYELGIISLREEDLFACDISKTYDMVFSIGLIEHFIDVKQVIKKHTDLLSQDGSLLIILPNFKGVNGWFQRFFDYENYNKHNLEAMNLAKLRAYAEELGLLNIEVDYYGKYTVWLEDEKNKPVFTRFVFKLIWLKMKILCKLFSLKSKLFSPYIVITAKK